MSRLRQCFEMIAHDSGRINRIHGEPNYNIPEPYHGIAPLAEIELMAMSEEGMISFCIGETNESICNSNPHAHLILSRFFEEWA